MIFLYPLLFLAAALHIAHYYPLVPDRLASHFDGSGAPNGWMTKDGFFLFYAGMLAFITGVFAGCALLIRRIPPRLMNLPNKEYWLAPERRENTLRLMSRDFLCIGLVAGAFIIITHHMVIMTNLSPGGKLGTAGIVATLLGLVSFIIFIAVRQYLRFRLPRGGASGE